MSVAPKSSRNNLPVSWKRKAKDLEFHQRRKSKKPHFKQTQLLWSRDAPFTKLSQVPLMTKRSTKMGNSETKS